MLQSVINLLLKFTMLLEYGRLDLRLTGVESENDGHVKHCMYDSTTLSGTKLLINVSDIKDDEYDVSLWLVFTAKLGCIVFIVGFAVSLLTMLPIMCKSFKDS